MQKLTSYNGFALDQRLPLPPAAPPALHYPTFH